MPMMRCLICVLQNIHDKVMSLNYQDAVTEIYSVDSQYSLSEGVIVQVTGSLQCTVRSPTL